MAEMCRGKTHPPASETFTDSGSGLWCLWQSSASGTVASGLRGAGLGHMARLQPAGSGEFEATTQVSEAQLQVHPKYPCNREKWIWSLNPLDPKRCCPTTPGLAFPPYPSSSLRDGYEHALGRTISGRILYSTYSLGGMGNLEDKIKSVLY